MNDYIIFEPEPAEPAEDDYGYGDYPESHWQN